MVALSTLALALSAVSATYAAPTLNARGSGSVSIPAVQNPNFSRNGTDALLKAYAKFNLHSTRPGGVSGRNFRRQDGSVNATPTTQDAEYLCPVSIGGEDLNLDFDTGSADLWVFSSLQPSSQLKGHDYYTSSKSSSYQALSGSTWKISYADGSGASGSVGTDTVTIGGTTVTGQAVELAKTASSSFVSGTGDGLVGLAFSSINTVSPTPQKTFFDNAQSSLDSPIFAAYLPWQKDGAYDFGYTDSSKFTGDIKYTPVDSSNGFWEFDSTSYKVGSTTHSQSGYTAIADTGTTLILMGDDAVSQYYSGVSGSSYDDSQQGYTFPCSATLPSLSVLIGDTNYATIGAEYLNYGATDSSGSTCFGSLQSVGSGTQNIYGDIFFNANYGVFDISVPQFGFAPSA
ncbi:MAG: Type I transmembrane sorting receptor [Claussenomyces sp. TS43310]|nr:MAG: Type I transmembrane sorting receptor [Claussenomyces sp. TS43310]